MNKRPDRFQIEDILEAIDISASEHNLSPVSPQSSPRNYSTRIEQVEMPVSAYNFPFVMTQSSLSPNLVSGGRAGGGRNNNRRKRSFIFKALLISSAILIVALISIPFSHSKTIPRNDKSHFARIFGGGSSSSSSNDDDVGANSSTKAEDLPDYASITKNNHNDQDFKIHETKSYTTSTGKEEVVQKSAAEALRCPSSVLNFVINATDAKDECDGLRKAFDKTCGAGVEKEQKGNNHGKRRLMSYIDEYDEGTSWKDSVKAFMTRFIPYRRNLQEAHEDHTSISKAAEDHGNADSKDAEENDSEPEVETEEKKDVKPLSPTLPTGSGLLTDQMAEDALGLNSELSDIAKAIEELGNSTRSSEHSGENSSGKAEEPKSSKDITSTVVAVSAIMNNPDVIEVQSCCRSILQVFHEECDSPDDEEYADRRLFVIVCVIALCGMIKSLIRYYKIRWLPEAGGCILVGVVGGLFLKLLPNIDFAFSHDMFLRVMVPPIGKTTVPVLMLVRIQ